MSAPIAGAAQAAPAYADMTIDELIDSLVDVEEYLRANTPKIAQAQKAQLDLKAEIGHKMAERGARKFENAFKRCRFEQRKSGSAQVHEADALREVLAKRSEVPAHALDEALPLVTPEPFVKPDLRKVRKLAEWGTEVAGLVKIHISEPILSDYLVIENVVQEIDVTPHAELTS